MQYNFCYIVVSDKQSSNKHIKQKKTIWAYMSIDKENRYKIYNNLQINNRYILCILTSTFRLQQ